MKFLSKYGQAFRALKYKIKLCKDPAERQSLLYQYNELKAEFKQKKLVAQIDQIKPLTFKPKTVLRKAQTTPNHQSSL